MYVTADSKFSECREHQNDDFNEFHLSSNLSIQIQLCYSYGQTFIVF